MASSVNKENQSTQPMTEEELYLTEEMAGAHDVCVGDWMKARESLKKLHQPQEDGR